MQFDSNKPLRGGEDATGTHLHLLKLHIGRMQEHLMEEYFNRENSEFAVQGYGMFQEVKYPITYTGPTLDDIYQKLEDIHFLLQEHTLTYSTL
jgi:hypothetical protein